VANRLRWDASLTAPEEGQVAWLRRQPARLVLLVGLVSVIYGSLAGGEWFDPRSGVLVVPFALLIAGIMLRRGTWPSTVRTVQRLPAVSATLIVLAWLDGRDRFVFAAQNGGGIFGISPAAIGVALVAASVIWLSVTQRRIVISPDLPSMDERGILLSGIGALVFAALGVVGTLLLAGPGFDAFSDVLLIAEVYVLAGVGTWFGARVGRLASQRTA
jgi:hypothetical protein